MVALGVLLFLATFMSGHSGESGVLWLSPIGGLAVGLLRSYEQYRWAAVVGLLLFLMPWFFSFGRTAAVTWCWWIGGITGVLAGYKGFFTKGDWQAGVVGCHNTW